MRSVRLRSLAILATLAVALGGLPVGHTAAQSVPLPTTGSGDCGLSEVAFCDTFDQPYTRDARSFEISEMSSER